MKPVHVVVVATQSDRLNGLLRAIHDSGQRFGVLEEAATPALARLEKSTALGAARSAIVSAQGSVVWTPRQALPRLRDLIAQHFLGCRVVVLLCAPDSPLLLGTSPHGRDLRVVVLHPAAAGWEVAAPGATPPGSRWVWNDEQLVRRLRRPYLLPRPPGPGETS